MIGAGDNRLPALAKEVAGLHRETGQHATAMAEKALEAGAALNEAKELLKDDDAWKAWLEESFPETGMRVVTYEERDAANPEQFEIARAAVERAT